MRPMALGLLAVLMAGLGCRPSAGEVEDLKRRIESLEGRTRQLEGGRRVERKPAGKPVPMGPATNASTTKISLEGDATRAFLVGKKVRIKLPGFAAEGEYTLLATFDEDEGDDDFGLVVIEGDAEFVVECSSAGRSCAMSLKD